MLLFDRITILCLIAAVVCGCSLFSGKTDEVVLAPTEVGSPAGDAVTKDIGPAGGTLASPDGRFALTVPQNTLAETAVFSIQPITNSVRTGLGHAYRLGLDGKTFSAPLELTVHYDDHDLAGTVPEALTVASRGSDGRWHVLNPTNLDQTNKTISVSIKDSSAFSVRSQLGPKPTPKTIDFSFISRFRVEPTEATVRPGQGINISMVIQCKEQGLLDKLLGRTGDCVPVYPDSSSWRLSGPGSMDELPAKVGVRYVAPAKLPAEKTAWVHLTLTFGVSQLKPTIEATSIQRELVAKIRIQDQAYQVIGQHEALTLSGVICSLDEPFTVPGVITGYPMKYAFSFTPSSHTAGSVKWSGGGGLVTAEGSGTYTVEGLETAAPKIVMKTEQNVGHAPPGSATGPLGTGEFLTLLPLENAECRA